MSYKIPIGTIYSPRIVWMTRKICGYILKADTFQGEDMSMSQKKHEEVCPGLRRQGNILKTLSWFKVQITAKVD